MITIEDYKELLRKDGRNLAEIRRNDAANIVNQTFTGDIEYKRVYILDPEEGWHYTDAHYIKHSNPSISKDQVDTYLQFRPYEHHKVGSYVLIPDDTSPDLKFDPEDPIHSDMDNLWIIAGRENANQFVRYMVLKCNWQFKWVADIGGKRQILESLGCARNANSQSMAHYMRNHICECSLTAGTPLRLANYNMALKLQAGVNVKNCQYWAISN